MKTTRLGNSDITVSRLGIGTNKFADIGNEELVATFDEALARGVTFIDTADIYVLGKAESVLGELLKGRRDKVVLATKFAMTVGPDGKREIKASPAYANEALENSLKRLQTDFVDLYYLHRVDPKVAIEESVGAMSDMVKAGKVKSIGLSNVTGEEIRRAHSVHPISAVQMQYSLVDRAVEAEVLPTCRELGISFVAYGPLSFELLTGDVKTTDDLPAGDMYRRGMPQLQPDTLATHALRVDIMKKMGAEVGASQGQMALAWLLAKGEDIIPIPGSTKRPHLIENAAAVDIKLSAEQVATLDELFPPTV